MAALRNSLALLAALVVVAPSAQASSPVGPALPAGVTCVFEAMPPEDREIALILIVNELELSGGDNSNGSPRLAEVGRLMEEAHDRCLVRWPWTAGKSRNALAWASAALYREANAQAISHAGQDPAVVDAWMAEHRREIAATPRAVDYWLPALRRHLGDLGWGDKNAQSVGFAALYFAETVAQETLSRNFVRGVFVPQDAR